MDLLDEVWQKNNFIPYMISKPPTPVAKVKIAFLYSLKMIKIKIKEGYMIFIKGAEENCVIAYIYSVRLGLTK